MTEPTTGASQAVNRYLTAFYSGDFETARALVADHFSFDGPFLRADGKKAFFDGAVGLLGVVRGHTLIRQWEDGPDVCSWYQLRLETPAGSGTVPMSEWHTVAGGKLISARVLFDTAAFRALLPAR